MELLFILFIINLLWMYVYLEYLYIKNGSLGIIIIEYPSNKLDFYANNFLILSISMLPAFAVSYFLIFIIKYTKICVITILVLFIVKLIKDWLYNIYIKRHSNEEENEEELE